MQAIKIENLTFAYEEGLYAVNDLSLQVNEGEYIAIVGRNGSGKSTVAKLINGLLTPKSGSVEVFGKSTLDKKALFEGLYVDLLLVRFFSKKKCWLL